MEAFKNEPEIQLVIKVFFQSLGIALSQEFNTGSIKNRLCNPIL